MNKFSIKDIESLTGIKAHTLRIWELRYQFIKPKRTDTNIRFYDDEDLKTLLNVSLLNKKGVKISKIAKLNQTEIEALIMELSVETEDQSFQMHQLINCMLTLDEVAFEQVLRNQITMFGITQTMIGLVFPFLQQIGLMWQSATINPAYEHFISNLIRAKLIIATDAVGYKNVNGNCKKFLLFLAKDEYHEIGLLFANYIIRSAGHHTMYLGQNLHSDDVRLVVKDYKPDFIFTSVTTALHPKTIKKLFEFFTESKIPVLLAGQTLLHTDVILPANVSPVFHPEDIQKLLK